MTGSGGWQVQSVGGDRQFLAIM